MDSQAVNSPRGNENHFDKMLQHLNLPDLMGLIGSKFLFRPDDAAYPDIAGRITGAWANGEVLFLSTSIKDYAGNPIEGIKILIRATVQANKVAATLCLQNEHRRLIHPRGFEYGEPSEVGFLTIL